MPKKEKENKETTTPNDEPETGPDAPETALAKPEVSGITSPVLLDMATNNPNPLFMTNYGDRLRSTNKPSPKELLGIVNDLPPQFREAVTNLMRTMMPNRPGLYLSEDRPSFTELRLFHGTGDDKNRPENTVPGQFYLTTKKNVGNEFVGAVIALWQGRTMWPPQGEEARMPVCTSMDRRIGGKFGDCFSCPHRPWKDGKKQDCSDDTIAFMLPKDLSDIVMVRFQRTSAKSGEQLATFAKKDLVPWQRWFKLTTEKQVSGDKRWFIINVNPVTTEYVPVDLAPFCAALEQLASHDFILPSIGKQYRTAFEAIEQQPETDGPAPKDGDGYGDISL